MHTISQAVPISKPMLWTGRVMSVLPVLLILYGSILKLIKTASMIEGFNRVGVPERLIVPVGIIELTCVVLYAIPRTSVLGAILLTGLLGGAALTTLRVGDPTYLLAIFVGMLAWGGLYLRDRRLQALIPFRQRRDQ